MNTTTLTLEEFLEEVQKNKGPEIINTDKTVISQYADAVSEFCERPPYETDGKINSILTIKTCQNHLECFNIKEDLSELIKN